MNKKDVKKYIKQSRSAIYAGVRGICFLFPVTIAAISFNVSWLAKLSAGATAFFVFLVLLEYWNMCLQKKRSELPQVSIQMDIGEVDKFIRLSRTSIRISVRIAGVLLLGTAIAFFLNMQSAATFCSVVSVIYIIYTLAIYLALREWQRKRDLLNSSPKDETQLSNS